MTLKTSKIYYLYNRPVNDPGSEQNMPLILYIDLLMTLKASKTHYYIDLLMTLKASKIHYYYIYTIDLLMTLKANKIYYYSYNRPVDDAESQHDTLPYILIQTC